MKTPMRCCKKCGCYLPDKSTLCLACGYDERNEISTAASAAPAGKAGVLYDQDPGCFFIDQSVLYGLKRRYVTFGTAGKECVGYSYDEKPQWQPDGTHFRELDTGRTYRFNAQLMQWQYEAEWM